jgi:acyl-CoA thioesterase-2
VDTEALKTIQDPLKARYREEPTAALVTLRRRWRGCVRTRNRSSTVPLMADESTRAERGEAESRDVAELLRVLDLEELDRDIFRGVNPQGDQRRPRLFGGQVAAQAARAASLTVPDDRSIHSLHGYFLRAGRADRPTILHVGRDRDGGSYSARHVAAVQDGEVIMSLLVSFHVDEDGPEFQAISKPDGVPEPETLAEPATTPHKSIFDLRITGRGEPRGDGPGSPHQFWARARGPLPDDRLLQACVLTYLSDVGTGLAKLPPHDPPWWGPSLDHAVWFHHAARMDDWVLVDLVPMAAAGARGFYTGTVHDRAGRLLATIAQEHVMRPQVSR